MIKTIPTSEMLTRGKDLTGPVFADIETEDLYVNCSLIQLRQSNETYIITTNADDEVAHMVEFMRPMHLVFWGGNYDLGTLKFVPAVLDDLWIAFKIAYPKAPGQNFDLLSACRHLGYSDLYVDIDKKGMQKEGFIRKAYLSQQQLRYAADDVEALDRMWNDERIQKVVQNNLAYKLAIYALREAMIWQKNGLPILKDKVREYKAKTHIKIEKYMAELETLVGRPLNPRSSKQVKEYLGTSTSDKAILTRIALEGELDEAKEYAAKVRVKARNAQSFTPEQQKAAELVLLARKAKNDLSKLNQYDYDVLYGFFSPVGARTSRWSCKGSKAIGNTNNLQNYSRDFKSCFGIKEGSGKIIVAADFATLEIRIAAAIMKEPAMYKALMAGADIHKATASLIYDKPLDEIHGRERSNAKVANFGLTYGMGKETFKHYAYDMYGIKFTDAEVKILVGKFFAAYPGLKTYHNMVGDKLRKHNYVCQTALGYKMKPQAYAEAINGPTQGTGGEVMRLAIHILIEKDGRVINYIVNSIHDAAYLIVPEEEKDYWGKLLKDSMQEAWYEIRKSKVFHYHDIPMPIDLMFGYSMGDLEEDFAGGGQALSVEEMRATQARNA